MDQDLKDHIEFSNRRFDKIIKCTEDTQRSMDALKEDISPMIEAYQDIQGVTRLGLKVQNFLWWVAKWPMIGLGLYTGIMWIIEYRK